MKKLTVFLAVLLSTTNLPLFASDKVLATVNDTKITEPMLKVFQQTLEQEVSKERALQEMINIELLQQSARKKGLHNDPEFQIQLKRQEDSLLANRFLQQHIAALNLTDEQLKKRYDSEIAKLPQEKEYNANHILVKTEKEAANIIQQLQSGAEFEALAKKLSTGPSGKDGGALGWFKQQDMVGPFATATTELSKGKFSQAPVQTQFGWHVIKLNDVRDVERPTFESVKKRLATALTAQSISELLKELRDNSKIEIHGE